MAEIDVVATTTDNFVAINVVDIAGYIVVQQIIKIVTVAETSSSEIAKIITINTIIIITIEQREIFVPSS